MVSKDEADPYSQYPPQKCKCPRCKKLHEERMRPQKVTPYIFCRDCKQTVANIVNKVHIMESHNVGYY